MEDKKAVGDLLREAFVQYKRRDSDLTTWVRKDMKGKSEEYNACVSCVAYKPFSEEDNCGYAKQILEMFNTWGIVLVIWECPVMEFEKAEGWTCLSCGALNSDDGVLCSYCGLSKEEI